VSLMECAVHLVGQLQMYFGTTRLMYICIHDYISSILCTRRTLPRAVWIMALCCGFLFAPRATRPARTNAVAQFRRHRDHSGR
jgi:hypothetical protein